MLNLRHTNVWYLGNVMKNELTSIQKKILDFLIEKIGTGLPPSLAEIAEYFEYKNRATVQQHLSAIEKKGYIRRNPKISRGIELTLDEKMFISKPVLGEVAAGNPLMIYPDSTDTINLPSIINVPGSSFILRVKGDSLKDAYIFEGDYVIVNPNMAPSENKIVVAVLDDSAVVKRFVIKKDMIELHSENPEYEPISVEKNYHGLRIVGVVVGVYRNMEGRIN